MPYLIRARRCSAFVSLAGSLACFFILLSGFAAGVENAPPVPNSDPTYQALRNLTLSGESVSVNNLELKRDAGTFHLRSGSICFVAPVGGKVTAAVFLGDGNFVLDPPQSERAMLKLLIEDKAKGARW